MFEGVVGAGLGAGEGWSVLVRFAGGAGVFYFFAVIGSDCADHVVVVILDDFEDGFRAGGNAGVVWAFDAFIGVDNDEEVACAVFVSVVCFHCFAPLIGYSF